jgi:hypothetical protein
MDLSGKLIKTLPTLNEVHLLFTSPPETIFGPQSLSEAARTQEIL